MAYVDGFVVPVPKKNLAKYKKAVLKAAKIWKEYGALQYVECIADDVKVGKVTSFPQAVKLKKDEVVAFSWVVYKTRTHRNQIMKKIMNDPRLQDPDMMPFDGMRMIYGGFKPLNRI